MARRHQLASSVVLPAPSLFLYTFFYLSSSKKSFEFNFNVFPFWGSGSSGERRPLEDIDEAALRVDLEVVEDEGGGGP